jgi:antitoxin component YwqK of YwqJK toxin-antitoxin module
MRHVTLCLLAALAAAADPPKDGKYAETWPDGKPKLEAHYKEYEDGKWEGRRAAWWPNGQVQFDWQYHEGKLREGKWESFHGNGAPWTSYVMGALGKAPDQEQVAYHDNGQVHYRGWWRDEKQDGKWVYFYPDGKRSEVRHYKKGPLHGLLTKWNEKGEVTSRIEYRNGKPKE